MRLVLLLLFSISCSLFSTDYPEDEKPKKDITNTKKELDITKKDLTDTKKGLKISKKDLTDTTKLLEIRSGDLMDTKAMLRKTDFPNPEQVIMLKSIMAAKLGGSANYRTAMQKSPAHVKSGLQSIWEIYRIDQDIKEVNSSLAVKEITDGRKKFLLEKKESLNKSRKLQSDNVSKMENYLEKLIQSEAIASKGEFFENAVAFEGGVDLIDKLGEAKARLKKGTKVKTKVYSKDTTFYLIEYKGEVLFAKRDLFKLK